MNEKGQLGGGDRDKNGTLIPFDSDDELDSEEEESEAEGEAEHPAEESDGDHSREE